MLSQTEFKFDNIFPSGKHYFVEPYHQRSATVLKGSCNFTQEDVKYFVNLLRTMMSGDTEEEFDSQWAVAQLDDHFKQNKKVYSYFSNNLIPAIRTMQLFGPYVLPTSRILLLVLLTMYQSHSMLFCTD